MNRQSIKTLIFVLLLCQTFMAFEKSGTTSLQFLSIRPSARAASMGGAFTTIVDNADACFWNPASLSRIPYLDFSASYTSYFLDVKLLSFSLGYNSDDWGAIGVFGQYTDVGSIEVTKVSALGFRADNSFNPGLTGETFSPTQFVGGLAYSAQMTQNFAFGIAAKFVMEDLVYESVSTFAFDGGISFNTAYRSIRLGAAIKNFGPDVKFIDKKFPIPQTLNIGVSANLVSPGNDNLLLSIPDQTILCSYDIVQPRDFDQQHAVGLEWSLYNFLALRGGYKFNADQESLSGGLGVHYNGFTFDYSYNTYGEYLPTVHRVTLGIGIGK